MSHIGKVIVITGLAIVVVGLVVWGLGKLGFRGLPGDIRSESDRVKFYFPIATCLAVSLVLSVVIWVVRMIGK